MRKSLYLILFLVACGSPSAPALDIESRAVPSDASPAYEQWWNELEACSGLTGDFRAVRFYEIPNTNSFEVDGVTYWGYWVRSGNKIIMASVWATSPKWVKHEEMHALLQRTDHPSEYFNGACGNLL